MGTSDVRHSHLLPPVPNSLPSCPWPASAPAQGCLREFKPAASEVPPTDLASS
ncbi:hypothetical protein C8Q79DRAFT_996238 [Trametes meyenii]|nr:hypothetical protein C8Q79DRAFT_996238 [Trametes meyenii]